MQVGERGHYYERQAKDDGGLARWGAVKMVRSNRLDVDFKAESTRFGGRWMEG